MPQPTLRQHLLQFLRSAVPFVGFGFLDNSIVRTTRRPSTTLCLTRSRHSQMLISGDFIEENIGTVLAISTMASAALGNAVSDVAGIGFSRFIEAFSDRLGLPNPGLTVQQLELRSIARTRALGNVIGVAVGCLLGMAPLLFMHKSKHSTDAVPDAV